MWQLNLKCTYNLGCFISFILRYKVLFNIGSHLYNIEDHFPQNL